MLWAVIYLVSLVLPALVYDSRTVWEGWRAAAVALFLYFVVVTQPLGWLLAMLYPLLIASLYGILRGRPFAVGTAMALVATMALWGFSAPPEPRSNIFGSTDPGGQLGSGFWLWLASGLCLVAAALTPPLSRRHVVWSQIGFGYAALVILAAAAVRL
jgi:hypothetical protein